MCLNLYFMVGFHLGQFFISFAEYYISGMVFLVYLDVSLKPLTSSIDPRKNNVPRLKIGSYSIFLSVHLLALWQKDSLLLALLARPPGSCLGKGAQSDIRRPAPAARRTASYLQIFY